MSHPNTESAGNLVVFSFDFSSQYEIDKNITSKIKNRILQNQTIKKILTEHNIATLPMLEEISALTIIIPESPLTNDVLMFLKKIAAENKIDARVGYQNKAPKKVPPQEPEAAQLQKLYDTYKGQLETDAIDLVTGQGSFWPYGIYGNLLGAGTTIAIMDTPGITKENPFLSHLNIANWNCANGIQCLEGELKVEGGDTGFMSTFESGAHATHVAGIVLRYLPGVTQVDALAVQEPEGSTGSRYNSALMLALGQIEANLAALERSGKNYAYVLNASLNFGRSLTLTDDTTGPRALRAKLSFLLNKYPRFLVINSIGNEHLKVDADSKPISTLPGVITVASHGPLFQHSYFTNYGDIVTTSAIGERVMSLSSTTPGASEEQSGSSMAGPSVTGIAAIIMQIIPDIKNHEVKQIIEKLSVDPAMFAIYEDQPPQNLWAQKNFDLLFREDAPFNIQTPVLIFDIIKVCAMLESEYKSRVDPETLNRICSLSKSYILDNLPENGDILFSIPNYDRQVQFNLGDTVQFKVELESDHPQTNNEFSFSVSSKLIPPVGITNFFRILKLRHHYLSPGNIFSAIQSVRVPNHEGKQEINISLRRNASTIDFAVRDTQGNLLEKGSTDYIGDGDVSNLMLGLGAKPGVRIVKLHAIAAIEDKPSFVLERQSLFSDWGVSDVSEKSNSIASYDVLQKTGFGAFLIVTVLALSYLKRKLNYTPPKAKRT